MIKTFTDKITLKPIEYSEESIFVIYIKDGYHKKRAIRFFTSDMINLTLEEIETLIAMSEDYIFDLGSVDYADDVKKLEVILQKLLNAKEAL
jgi:hypothetical protein